VKTSRHKSKPDLLLVLALIAGIGVVVSTRAEGPQEPAPIATTAQQSRIAQLR